MRLAAVAAPGRCRGCKCRAALRRDRLGGEEADAAGVPVLQYMLHLTARAVFLERGPSKLRAADRKSPKNCFKRRLGRRRSNRPRPEDSSLGQAAPLAFLVKSL